MESHAPQFAISCTAKPDQETGNGWSKPGGLRKTRIYWWAVCRQMDCSPKPSRLSDTKGVLSQRQEREKRKHKWLLSTEMYLQQEGDLFFVWLFFFNLLLHITLRWIHTCKVRVASSLTDHLKRGYGILRNDNGDPRGANNSFFFTVRFSKNLSKQFKLPLWYLYMGSKSSYTSLRV